MNKISRGTLFVIFVGIFWLGLALLCWVKTPTQISISERRKLAQFPKPELQSILSGKFMEDFEPYAQDQFPERFMFRRLKAITSFYVLANKDNNDIYIEKGHAAKLEYPLREASVRLALDKFRYIYNSLLKNSDSRIFLSVIPDKGYFLADQYGYPSMDYQRMLELLRSNTEYAEYIDLFELLELEDYYRSDIHWKQENLIKVAEKLGASLGCLDRLSFQYDILEPKLPFYGVYYGQSALPIKPDAIKYLVNSSIQSSSVYNLETNQTGPVYDTKKLSGRDPYDLYLSGASAMLVIDNPEAKTDKELVVFRDSFGSSLVPLLIEGYSKITLIDIRYMASQLISEYITFKDQDVLFLYSTSILNSAESLK